ncbi:MAG: AMP-binding protein [Clostridia bacterium]|nr:AMP-binding protein [Clostridia bacterium]
MNLLKNYLNKIEFDSYEDFCGLKIDVPADFNFGFDVVDEYAKLEPDKRAIVWCNSSGEEKIISFGELSVLSNKVANILVNRGIKKGDYIMTMLNRRWEYWAVAVGCHKLGVTIIPATHLLTAKDIAYRCNAANVKILFATSEFDVIEHTKQALPKCETLVECMFTGIEEGFACIDSEIEKASAEFPSECVRPALDDSMLCYFTSGTTGFPKMVEHSFSYPLGHIITAKYWQCVVDDGIHFTMAETGWAKASWGKIYGQWLSGTAIFAYDYNGRFTPTDVLPLIEYYKITTFCAPPTIYRFLIKEDLSKYNFSSLSHCTTAGEALNPEIFKQFYESTGQKIYEGFGQTESTVLLASFNTITPIPGSLGKPSPIYQIDLINDDEEIVPDGKEGEIALLNSATYCGLVSNYKNDLARTNDARGGKYYHTGDLAIKDDDGMFWFVGRKDDIIKSSGYRIGPFEVESALMEHPSVLECAITGAPDPLRGQVVKATIVLAKNYTASEELKKELQTYVKVATAPYKYPRIIEFVEELPKTVSGKIRRVEIRKKDNE